MNKNDKLIIHDKKSVWYLTYIDSTHFYSSNDKNHEGIAFHIGQIRGELYYDDVYKWLKGQLTEKEKEEVEKKIYETKKISKRIIKEERLGDQFAEYKVKDEKIKIILKNQQASKLTKIVNAWNDLSKQVSTLEDQRKSIADSLATAKNAVEQLRDDARDAIIEIVDVNEAVMSIVVKCAGSTLSLAKQSDQVQGTDVYIDYKQAWETLYKLLEGDNGLKKMMDDTIKTNTSVELSITQAKRALRLKTKESSYKSGKILTEISLQLYFDKIINFIKKQIKKLWNAIDINKVQVKKYTNIIQKSI
jgi:hypothetical protein